MNAISFQVDNSGVAVITIDVHGEEANKLSSQDMLQIEEFLNRVDDVREILENEKEIKAVVLISGKEDNFITGANLGEFLKIASVEEGRSLSLKAQEVLSRIENSRAPFIAAIHGRCLGVGLEIALACRFRIATDAPKTLFGLTEVELGLIPCGGGTQRLPRLVGIPHALDMILTGKIVDWKQAMETGLVDEVVPKDILIDIAKKRAVETLEKKLKPHRPAKRGFGELIIEKNPVGRKLLFNKARKRVVNKTNINYLAPLMALEAVEVGMNSSFNRGLHVESVYFSELVLSDVSRHLINIFLACDDIKKDPVTQNTEIKPRKVEKIAVVGAGFRGREIAAISADIGVRVRLKDKDMKCAGEALKSCYDYFEEGYGRQSITRNEMEKKLDLVSTTSDYTGFRMADLVIEAVPEDLELKRKVFKEVESVTREDCIFASSTPSIPISQIAAKAKRPGNVIGMHFFSPVHRTLLLEIVATKDSSEVAIATALEFGKRLGKTPIVVSDGAGFYTTRIFTPYLNEAIRLLGEGATIEDVDTAMVEFGFPVGPLTLIDEAGIDGIAKIMAIMYEAFGERLKPPSSIKKLIQDGRLGKKNKRGFYSYNGKEKVDVSVYKLLSIEMILEKPSREEIQERLSLAINNEALFCLQEGIIGSPRDGDIGAVLGFGFPSFLGGPFRYVDSIGAGTTLKKLEYMASRLGPHFYPAGLLRDLARQGKRIYPDSN
ncbi:MAG: enoyl-CoA hydratase/isomerase family protein [Deltaproteobacteria bacterium]|nr:enoyl-CoA hydratase/isomerase family protein [Deltaproteobacteria bacterium]